MSDLIQLLKWVSKIHIVFVERGYPRRKGESGGAGTYVKLFGSQLVKMGYSVSVICGNYHGNMKKYLENGIDIYPDFEYHPISYLFRKIPLLNIFFIMLPLTLSLQFYILQVLIFYDAT